MRDCLFLHPCFPRDTFVEDTEKLHGNGQMPQGGKALVLSTKTSWMSGQHITTPLEDSASFETNVQHSFGTSAKRRPLGDDHHLVEPSQRRQGEQSTRKRYHSSSNGCSVTFFTLFMLSCVLLGCALHSSFNHQLDPKGCQMTYMYPSYYKIMGFDHDKTRLAGKYGLVLYRHDSGTTPPISDPSQLTRTGDYDHTIAKSAKIRVNGIPALFIPGNAGSAKQVRSIATEAWKYHHETAPGQGNSRMPWSKSIDFFTVDLNEEFSAFHGQLLLEQAGYVNEAIAYILSLYSDNNSDSRFPKPKSVLIIGHSMGGVVARTLFTMDNYLPGSVNTIVTLATPHMVPPLALDYEITRIYDKIEAFWRQGYENPHSTLVNVSLVSILGGNQDITVNSDSGNIHHIVPQSHGFAVFTSSIPNAWVGSDHLSILWCNQVVRAIGKALGDIVDARNVDQVKPLGDRMKIFRNRLLTGSEDHTRTASSNVGEETISLSNRSYTFEKQEHIWTLPSTPTPETKNAGSPTPHLYILPIPKHQEPDTLTLLMSCRQGPNCDLSLLLCNDRSETSTGMSSQPSTVLSCQHDNLSTVPIPASTSLSTLPLYEGDRFTDQEYHFGSKRLSDLAKFQYLVVEDRNPRRGGQFDEKFLIVHFKNEASTIETVETTTIGLLRRGLTRSKFPERPSLVSTLRLPNVDNSLLAYNLKVHGSSCRGSGVKRFSPLLKQSSWTMNEDKYAVNIVAKNSGIDINFHGNLPYFDEILLRDDKGIDLQFWTDPTCPEYLTFTLSVDKYGSLGKVVIRYRTAILVFSFMVVILTLRAQIEGWGKDGTFKPFGIVLSQLATTTFAKFSVLLVVLFMIQSMKSRAMASLDLDILADNIIADKLIKGYHLWFPTGWLDDALLGRNEMFFWFLAPVFFQVAVGVVAFVWFVLNSIVKFTAILTKVVTKKNDHHRSQDNRGRVVAVAACVLVATVVPYQFAFAATVVALIIIGARAMVLAQRETAASAETAWNHFHFTMAILVMFFFLLPFAVPALVVWIRNGAVGWWKSFGPDHRVDYVAPFIIFVQGLANGKAVTKTSWRRYVKVTVALLDAMLGYLVVFGVRYTWQIYFLTRAWVSWLVVLRLLETEVGRTAERWARQVLVPLRAHTKQE
ncbi:PGAP1-like protein-domain-containing protein [Dissophora ornata]|nr:PGAP1-like protein-domain-containing protein [Dissophora ornata]